VHVSRVALRVSDLDGSIDYYSRLAGLELRGRDAGGAALGAPDGGPALLELRPAERPGRAPRAAAGLFHTALRYPDRRRLAAALRRVLASGARLTGASDHGVSEALYLDDPDGLGVELYWDRPREQWPEPRPGERVGMFTAPLDLEGVLSAGDGELPEAAQGVDVGHVHLKVGDVDTAARFWTGEIGMQEMVRLGDEAAFLADGDYHHHVGVNTWLSRGAGLEPPEGPGLDAVVLAGDRALETRTPDGVRVLVEPS
jgi:catechol 2,3-dioxygenase